MIRDRGNIKWTAMMLPEHVKALRGFDWDQTKKEKPELDEQHLSLMEETIREAMAENLELCFTYFQKDDFHLYIGKVHFIDTYRKELRVMDFHEETFRLKLENLVDVRIHHPL
ncbi:YolD-like family protein [Fictibacillus terranigra]|uniref:YolD-like family protein n=1 Tax=Fictibacillus terranigra TaxID=3058424 RepID=A0ABT8ECA4_9BACL|nr:YolD-like family protein [Fictibacillus sp. CENA-BCM004]MDN4075515.1 YolD-like family protein [Fictibacillus sp. CENA-BCM004]